VDFFKTEKINKCFKIIHVVTGWW